MKIIKKTEKISHSFTFKDVKDGDIFFCPRLGFLYIKHTPLKFGNVFCNAYCLPIYGMCVFGDDDEVELVDQASVELSFKLKR